MKRYVVICYWTKENEKNNGNNLKTLQELVAEIKKIRKNKNYVIDSIFATQQTAKVKAYQLLKMVFKMLCLNENISEGFDVYVVIVRLELPHKDWDKLIDKHIQQVVFYRGRFNAKIKEQTLNETSEFSFAMLLPINVCYDHLIDKYVFSSLMKPFRLLHNRNFYKHEQRLKILLYFIYCIRKCKHDFPLDVLYKIASFSLHRKAEECNQLVANLIKPDNINKLVSFFDGDKPSRRFGFIIEHSKGKFKMTLSK